MKEVVVAAPRAISRGDFNLDGLAATYIDFADIGRMFHCLDHPDPGVKKMVLLLD